MFTPFVISEFKTGLFSYLQPWISPRDSFSEAENVYVNRGCLFSREGLELIGRRFSVQMVQTTGQSHAMTLPKIFPNSIEVESSSFKYRQNDQGGFDRVSGTENVSIGFNQANNTLSMSFPSSGFRDIAVSYNEIGGPIRAIIPFGDQQGIGYGHILVDDKGMCLFLNGERVPRVPVDQAGFFFKAKQRTFNFSIPWEFHPNSLAFTFLVNGTTTVIKYNNGVQPQGPVQSISYTPWSRLVTGSLGVDPTEGDSVRISLIPNIVFNGQGGLVSWDSSRNFIVISNGLDPILFFNICNKTISRPFLPITESALWSGTNQIQSAKFVKFFKNRLLLLDTRIVNAGDQNGRWKQSVRWSAPFLDQKSFYSHWNFVADRNYGGEYSPDTNAIILGCGGR